MDNKIEEKIISPCSAIISETAAAYAAGTLKPENELSLAIIAGDHKKVHDLLDSGANLNHAGTDHFPPLVLAVMQGNESLVYRLLEHKGIRIQINKSGLMGITALFMASHLGNFKLVNALLNANADPRRMTECPGINGKIHRYNALHEATVQGNFEIVKAIISSDYIAMHFPREDGYFPLHIAVLHARVDLVELMIADCPQVDLMLVNPETPFHLALKHRHHAIIKKLLARGASCNLRAQELAIESNDIAIMELMLPFFNDRNMLRNLLQKIYARYLSEADSNQRQKYLEMSDHCKGRLNKFSETRVLTLDDIEKNASWNFYFSKLFQKYPDPSDKIPQDLDSAMRYTLILVFIFLQNPVLCIPYIQFLNQELERHWKIENPDLPLPVFNATMADSWKHDGMEWLIPNEKYQSIKRNNLMARVLLDIFKRHGMGENQYKWIGFLPYKLSRKLLQDNAFFSEDKRIPSGLFHGNTHNIQRVILLLAMEAGAIPLTYKTEKGETFQLQPREIFSTLMRTDIFPKDAIMPGILRGVLWTPFLDIVSYTTVTFSHPHRMHSMLMAEPVFSGAFQDYLRYSFCDHFIKMRELHNRVYQRNYNNREMAEETGKLRLHIFNTISEFSIQMEEKKHLQEVDTIDQLSKKWRKFKNQEKNYKPLRESVNFFKENKVIDAFQNLQKTFDLQ